MAPGPQQFWARRRCFGKEHEVGSNCVVWVWLYKLVVGLAFSRLEAIDAGPEDLVLALTLFDRMEKLGDDLYQLSQIAYDNDLEEPATRLTELLATVDHNQDLIEGYVFDLAAKKQKQLLELRRENQQKLATM